MTMAKKITDRMDSVYCVYCGGPSRMIKKYNGSARYRCEGGQQDGFFHLVVRSQRRGGRP